MLFSGGGALNKFPRELRCPSLLLMSLPYWVVVLVAVLLSTLPEIVFEQHRIFLDYKNPNTSRWRFLHSSANGFGFDAFVCCISSTCGIFLSTKIKSKLLFFASLTVALYALIMSETRSAMLAYLVFVTIYCGLAYRLKNVFALSCFVGLPGAILLLFLGGDEIRSFLRVYGDLNQISSGRYDAYKQMLQIIVTFPFEHVGFGNISEGVDFAPTNLFFPGIIIELGVLGGAAVILFCCFPIIRCIKIFHALKKKTSHQPLDLMIVAFASALLCWQLFEFDLFRVSATNQIFFICWGYVLAKCLTLKGNKNFKRLGDGTFHQ